MKTKTNEWPYNFILDFKNKNNNNRKNKNNAKTKEVM